MYSALVLNKAIVSCFLADQEIVALQKMNAYLETDLREFELLAQSESVNPTSFSLIQLPW